MKEEPLQLVSYEYKETTMDNYGSKLDKLLEIYNLLRLKHAEREKSVIKNFPTKKNPGPDASLVNFFLKSASPSPPRQWIQKSHLWIYFQRNEIRISEKHLHSHVHCSIINNSHNVELL
jgi:hypothetical protein